MFWAVKDLKKHYPIRSGLFSKSKEMVYAVDGISFNLEEDKTLGLVGKGCNWNGERLFEESHFTRVTYQYLERNS
jgi:ABC-type microcin C transport system duplicated ATPase subunit YejF